MCAVTPKADPMSALADVGTPHVTWGNAAPQDAIWLLTHAHCLTGPDRPDNEDGTLTKTVCPHPHSHPACVRDLSYAWQPLPQHLLCHLSSKPCIGCSSARLKWRYRAGVPCHAAPSHAKCKLHLGSCSTPDEQPHEQLRLTLMMPCRHTAAMCRRHDIIRAATTTE